MNISNYIFICFFPVLFLSCAQGEGKGGRMTERGTLEKKVDKNDAAQNKTDDVESFEQFIYKFSTQESFQLQRVKFPISVIIPDSEHEGMAPMEEVVGRYEWELLDLTYDSTFQTRPYDQYYQDVRYLKDTAVVEIRGINNGIYADYYFTLIENKWYLVTLYEASF